MEKQVHILFAEDDINLRFVTQDNLERHGFKVDSYEDGKQAWEAFQQQPYDLCLLDVMLPEMDGFSLAGKIRTLNQQVPVLFLTAKSMKEDKIAGFQIGGDDYITKPFSIDELIMRIEVFLRRSTTNGKPIGKTVDETNFSIGCYTLDFPNLRLSTMDGHTSTMTLREAELLRYFCRNQNQLLKREDILNHIWGTDDYFTGRSLDVFISRLRKYLSQDKTITIENVHGVGFRMEVKVQA